MKFSVRQLHFVGIGGTGMCGIAEVLLNLGYRVTGSDLAVNAATERLSALGATVFRGHEAGHIAGADAVVVSSAVTADNPEVVAARAAHIPVVPRAAMLAELMRLRRGIAIAGTHGKTTTTSLTAALLAAGGLDPTYVIGGRLNSSGSNARLGAGEYIVAEADESDASFLNLTPVVAVITNIDRDHMETYGHDFERLKGAFVDFVSRLPFYGVAIVCGDDENARAIIPRLSRRVIEYGLDAGRELRATDLVYDGPRTRFVVHRPQRPPLPVTLNLPGEHNVRDALAAIAVADLLGVGDEAIAGALERFTGVGRRFARYGAVPLPPGAAQGPGSYELIDDYGHHPREMRATMAAVRGAWPGRRLVVVFQPHRYSRTRDCFEDFVRVLVEADAVILAEIYPAGEKPLPGVDGRALARALRAAGQGGLLFCERLEEIPAALARVVRDGDVVLTIGAGSIGRVAAGLAEGAREGAA